MSGSNCLPRLMPLAGAAVAALVSCDALAQSCETSLQSPIAFRGDPQTEERLGRSVAANEDRVFSGAPDWSGGRGRVAAFDDTSGGWSDVYDLGHPGVPEGGDRFGEALAVVGDLLAIGAPGDRIGALDDAGSVHVFSTTSIGATVEASIDHPVPAQGDQFGLSIDLAFDPATNEYFLAVGTPFADGGGADLGRVYVFRAAAADLTTLTQVATLESLVAADDDQFGFSVAITPEFVVAGVPFRDRLINGTIEPDAGAIEVFMRDSGGGWSTAGQVVVSPDPFIEVGTDVNFGFGLDADGDRIAVGAPNAQPLATGCSQSLGETRGRVEVYRWSGSTWSLEQFVLPEASCDDTAAGLGVSVELRGELLAAGTLRDPGDGGRLHHLFRRTGSTWVPVLRSRGLPGGAAIGTGQVAWSAVGGVIGDVSIQLAASGPRLIGGAPSFGFFDLSQQPAGPFFERCGGVVVSVEPSPVNDCDGDGIEDACRLAFDSSVDCDSSGGIDSCEIADGSVLDLNGNGVPDGCDPDCNGNSIPDDLDIANGAPDCNGDGVPDECTNAIGADLFFLIDDSGSTDGKGDLTCALIAEVESRLTSQLIDFEVSVAVISSIANIIDCRTTDDTVIELYGSAVPAPPPSCCVALTSTESWLGASAIVSRFHPWRANSLKIVIPVSDECGHEGDDCDADDAAALEYSIDVLQCDGTFGFAVSTPSVLPGVDAQMESFADETLGYWAELEDIGGAGDVAQAIVEAVSLRLRRDDWNGNGLIDACSELVLPDGSTPICDPDDGIDDDTLYDCDDNGIADIWQIAVDENDRLGGSMSMLDADDDCILDDCLTGTAPCPADFDGSRIVGFEDLLVLLADYGCTSSCTADLNSDGETGFADLLILLEQWGWCPISLDDPCHPPSPTSTPAPASIWDCYQKAGGDPDKLAACIEAMLLAGTP